MARYQLLRPSPVKVVPSRVRRLNIDVTTTPATGAEEEEEEEEGPESPDSPFSSPSTVGGESDSDSSDSDSDSDDEEPPSPVENAESSRPVQTLGPDPTPTPALPTSVEESNASTTGIPIFTSTSQNNDALLPQMTGTTLATMAGPATTSVTEDVAQSDGQELSSATASVLPPLQSTTESDVSGESSASQRFSPQEYEPIMTKEAMVAAIILGILGALALLIAAVIFIRRRKRKSNSSHAPLPDEPLYPSNTNHFPAPETAHVGEASSVFARLNGDGGGGGGGGGDHLTRSTERTHALFGAGSYARPETVSTERNNRRLTPRTPNPFADPPLNKAYDMLNNRPRSTTLTDRGSWRENPFKNPESGRFDPFGELKEKARNEKLRYLQDAKREAELQQQMKQKEAMGLKPDALPWGVDNGYR